MPYSEKVHLRNCLIWFCIISVLSVIVVVSSYGKFDFVDYGNPREFALGCIIEYILVFLIYILPISIFRFCIRRKPVYTWIAAWLIAILYTALCSAVEVMVYDLLFDLQMDPVGRFHGFFIPFLLHGGQNLSEPTNDEQTVAEKDESSVLSQAKPSEYELQMRQEFKRYRLLRDERQKIPVDDVRQWHDEGKMTDDQYNKIMSAYNSMGEEMEDIRKRVKLLNQTNAYQPPAEENIPKKKETKKNNKIPVIIAWCSSVLLFVCISVIVLLYHQNTTLEKDYDALLKLKDNMAEQRTQYRNDYIDLNERYTLLDEKYKDLYWDHFELRLSNNKSQKKLIQIGDSQQTVIAVCGSPDQMVEQFSSWGTSDGWKWYYGTSYILFDHIYDTVEAWYIGDTTLPVE